MKRENYKPGKILSLVEVQALSVGDVVWIRYRDRMDEPDRVLKTHVREISFLFCDFSWPEHIGMGGDADFDGWEIREAVRLRPEASF